MQERCNIDAVPPGKDSIETNIASVKAAKAEKSVGNYLHAQDYMVYAHLQLGQQEKARAVVDEALKNPARIDHPATAYAYASAT